MKGPFPDVNLLCLGGRVRGAVPVATYGTLAQTLGWASPPHPSPCQSNRSIVPASPRQDRWQILEVGCSDSQAVASRPGTLICHDRPAWYCSVGGSAVGSKGGTCATQISQQADLWEQH